jgi:hypothetical protein
MPLAVNYVGMDVSSSFTAQYAADMANKGDLTFQISIGKPITSMFTLVRLHLTLLIKYLYI